MKILRDNRLVIRKPHNCWGCRREFPARTIMSYVVSVDGGDFNGVYWCQECSDFLKTLPSHETQDGFDYGGLLNYEEYANSLKVV